MVESVHGPSPRPGPGPRVVLVTAAFPTLSETFLVAKFRGLLDRGWDVHVACGSMDRGGFKRFPMIDGARFRSRVHPAPPHRPRVLPVVLLPWVVLRCFLAAPGTTVGYVRRGWRRWGPGVLRHLYLDAAIVSLAPDLVHFEFGSLAPERMHLVELLGCPVTVSFRGYDVDVVGHDDPAYYDPVWRSVTRVHVLGASVLARVQARGCPPEVPCQLISPAVDLATFSAVPRRDGRLGTADRPLRLLAVGRTEWRKGHEHLLAAAALIEARGYHVECHICGGGPRLGALGFARHELGLEQQVDLLGPVGHARVRSELAWADVLVHPALAEGFGNAVLEAQASGLPVVCSDAGGLPENVEHDVTGIVVPRADPDALADALAGLADQPDRRLAMGAAGARRVTEQFGAQAQLDAIESFLRAALGDTTPH